MVFHAVKRVLKPWGTAFTGVQKRFTHRAPSYAYLNQWEGRHVDFANEMDASFCRDQRPGANMKNSPERVSQVLRVEAAMKMRGLNPFVHAMPASSKVLLEFYKVFSPPIHNPHYFPIRSPFDALPKLEEVRGRVPSEISRDPRPELLSVSYALTSNTVPLESAASWGFVNHFGKEQYFPMLEHFASLLSKWGKKSGKEVPGSFHDRGRVLIRRYNRLKVGNFFVLGVPFSKLAEWMYDSKPYYVPTGRDIRTVVERPRVTAKEGTIATLMLAKEVLNPHSGLAVVSADDADIFCQGLDLVGPNQLEVYRQIMNSKPTEFERVENESRRKTDLQLEAFVSDFKNWTVSGQEPPHEEEHVCLASDLPLNLP